MENYKKRRKQTNLFCVGDSCWKTEKKSEKVDWDLDI